MVALMLYVPLTFCMPATICCANGEPLVMSSRKVSVTCDWFCGTVKLNLMFVAFEILIGTVPDTHTARPPLEGCIVGFWKPAWLGACTPAGMAPPGFEARN